MSVHIGKATGDETDFSDYGEDFGVDWLRL